MNTNFYRIEVSYVPTQPNTIFYQVRGVPALPAGVLFGGADAARALFTEHGFLFPIQCPIQLNTDFYSPIHFLIN